MVSFLEFSSVPFSFVRTFGPSFHVGMYLKSYLIILNIDFDCLLMTFQIKPFYIHWGGGCKSR